MFNWFRKKPDPMMSRAVCDVLKERRHQIMEHNFDAKHDDLYEKNELTFGALSYLFAVVYDYEPAQVPVLWKWHKSWWKPRSKRENLVRAIALAIAELERIDRLDDARAIAFYNEWLQEGN